MVTVASSVILMDKRGDLSVEGCTLVLIYSYGLKRSAPSLLGQFDNLWAWGSGDIRTSVEKSSQLNNVFLGGNGLGGGNPGEIGRASCRERV